MTQPTPIVKLLPLGIDASVVRIAFAQLPAPTEDERDIMVVRNRETRMWRSRAAIQRRLHVLNSVTNFVSQQIPKPHFLVFPGYAVPLHDHMEILQALADSTGIILIPGADHSYPDEQGHVFNCTALIAPNSVPVWIMQNDPSQVDPPFVDRPAIPECPLFQWKAGRSTYSLLVSIGGDFRTALREPDAINGSPLLCLVPMCSRHIDQYRAFADALVSRENGGAVILCNAWGEPSAGGESGAIVSNCSAGAPASVIKMPFARNCVSLISLDCDKLATRTAGVKAEHSSPVVDVRTYEVLPDTTDNPTLYTFAALADEGPAVDTTLAVINPYLYHAMGKTLRLAFLDIPNYGKLNVEEIKRTGVECFAVLGHKDLMISHLGSESHFLFDIEESIRPLEQPDRAVGTADSTAEPDHFPFFQVRHFHKVLGLEVPTSARNAFRARWPSAEQVGHIIALSRDWNDPSVSGQLRADYQRRGWILGTTTRQPGSIRAVICLFINHYKDLASQESVFEDRVLPALKAHPHITSIYDGSGTHTQMHYVVRIHSSIDELFKLIELLHVLASDARIKLSTSTYVIMKRLSELNIANGLRQADLSDAEARYYQEIIGHLNVPATERQSLLHVPIDARRRAIDALRRVESVIDLLGHRPWFRHTASKFRNELVVSLVMDDVAKFKIPHDLLQHRVEHVIRKLCMGSLTDQYLESVRDRANIQKGKMWKQLTYTDWVRLAQVGTSDGKLTRCPEKVLDDLLKHTLMVRNAFAHADFARVAPADALEAIVMHADFLSKWDMADE